MLLDPIGNRLRILQAMRVMGVAFLDHHRDQATRLMVDVLDGQSIQPQQRILSAANFQYWDVVPGQLWNFGEVILVQRAIIGIDARYFVGIDHAPVELIHPAFAHPDESGLLCHPMLLRQEGVPPVPRFALLAAIRGDERDMEPAPEQLDFSLGLVVPIAAPPGPRSAGRGLLGNDHHAPAFAALHGGVDTKARHLARKRRHGRDRARGIVHDEVITVESLVPGGLWAVEGDVSIGRQRTLRSPKHSQ